MKPVSHKAGWPCKALSSLPFHLVTSQFFTSLLLIFCSISFHRPYLCASYLNALLRVQSLLLRDLTCLNFMLVHRIDLGMRTTQADFVRTSRTRFLEEMSSSSLLFLVLIIRGLFTLVNFKTRQLDLARQLTFHYKAGFQRFQLFCLDNSSCLDA